MASYSASAANDLSQVTGLYDFWSTRSAHRGELTMRDEVMLSALGLGIVQPLQQIGLERPDFAAFLDWIIATAGRPDPLRLARYEAWCGNRPAPASVQQWLAAIDALPPVLDTDALTHWEREGYVMLRQAVSPAEAAAAAALLWRVAGADPANPASWYGERINGIMVQHFQDPALDVPRYSPRVHKAFAQLWGTADLWPMIDRMSFNPPLRPGDGFAPPRLHWDVSLAQPIPFATQGILYLTDTAVDQGALELVPGMHHGLGVWLDSVEDPRAVDLSARAITIAAGAGDLVIWRQDLPHGASPNRAKLPRLAHYVNFFSPARTTHPEWR